MAAPDWWRSSGYCNADLDQPEVYINGVIIYEYLFLLMKVMKWLVPEDGPLLHPTPTPSRAIAHMCIAQCYCNADLDLPEVYIVLLFMNIYFY